jgi:uncharacterized DUF497 family protein
VPTVVDGDFEWNDAKAASNLIGFSAAARLLYVVTTDGAEYRARIISAREVTAGERRLYQEQ